MSEKENDELRALLVAAARFFDLAQRSYRAERPDDHAAFCTLVEQGAAHPFVSVAMPPAVGIEVGVTLKGRREVFFSWHPPAGAVN